MVSGNPKLFRSDVDLATTVVNDDVMPYGEILPIYVCRRAWQPPEWFWPLLKSYSD